MPALTDPRIVLTLDAGGTSFRFDAVQAGRTLIDPPIRLPSLGHDLDASLGQLVRGFESVHAATGRRAVALALAFPGPSDYAHGVIGDLPNLPAFRGGVPVGPLLAAHFGLPAVIGNDGALFAYGEARFGLLPWVNGELASAGNPRRFANLLGFTLGTGFGGGLVVDGRLVAGDNDAAGQVWSTRHRDERGFIAEEGASIRGVRRAYASAAGLDLPDAPEPAVIAAIVAGGSPGDAAAARQAFRRLGQVAGDAIAGALALIDGLVVLGGGISGAGPLFIPALLEELNGTLARADGTSVARLAFPVLDLDRPEGLAALVGDEGKELPVGGTGRTVRYQAAKRGGIGVTRLGTSTAIALGAAALALERLDGG